MAVSEAVGVRLGVASGVLVAVGVGAAELLFACSGVPLIGFPAASSALLDTVLQVCQQAVESWLQMRSMLVRPGALPAGQVPPSWLAVSITPPVASASCSASPLLLSVPV